MWRKRYNKKRTMNSRATGPPNRRLSNNKCIYDLWSEIDTYNGFCIKKLHQNRFRVRSRRLLYEMINNLKLLVKDETCISSFVSDGNIVLLLNIEYLLCLAMCDIMYFIYINNFERARRFIINESWTYRYLLDFAHFAFLIWFPTDCPMA